MEPKEADKGRTAARVARSTPDRSLTNTLRIPGGTVILVTDIRADDPDEEEQTFVLTADDGTYDRSLSSKAGEVDEHQLVTLVFEDVPTRRRYRLAVRGPDGEEHTIFEDVPYEELSALTEDLKPKQLQPFASFWSGGSSRTA